MWIYQNNEVQDSDILPEYLGFIYIITNLQDNRKYIGRKLLTSAASKMVNGKKKKYRKESNWRDYWSSSPWLMNIIKEAGTENWQREILFFATSKSSLNYAEEKIQYALGVLEKDEWINDNIRSKMYRKWVKNFTNLTDLNTAIETLKTR